MKLVILTRSLNFGGAERQIVTLAKGLHARGHRVVVAPFYPNGPLEPDLHAAGVPVHCLEKKGTWDNIAFYGRLASFLRRERPEVLHGYLGTPNLTALAMRPLIPGMRIIWGVRSSNVDLNRYGWLSRVAYFAECRLSRFPDTIISNSRAGEAHAVANGFPADRIRVIPNGIDTARFRPDAGARRTVREQWGVEPDQTLVGLVGRLDPMKDHPSFLKAAALLTDRPELRFVLVGDGNEAYKRQLKEMAAELGLKERLIWAGARADMPAVYNALDLSTSSSMFGEGFPNVVGEAMACGVPCVVTDTGDSKWIVGDTGFVVPPGDPAALAAACRQALDVLTPESRDRVRRRIVENFSVEQLLDRTEEALCARP